MDAKEALSIARVRLMLDQPFFGALALRLALVEDQSIPTLAVDGVSVFYNPEYVMTLEPDYQMTAMAHEVMHCVLGHFARCAGRDFNKWNRACDYAENPMLLEAGFKLHPAWLYKEEYVGKSAEEIYSLLDDDEGGGGEAQCEIRPGSNQTSTEVKVGWEIASLQAAKAARGHGKVPGQIQKQLDEALAPTIPWQSHLAAFMTERMKNDYSWMRPNRFYMPEVYLPSLDGVGMGEVVIALDTSGSVAAMLDQFGAVVGDIINSVRPRRTVVIYCDARVNRVDIFNPGEPLMLTAVGGGGTDFCPPFKYVEEHGLQPACFLYLTDMYGDFPDAPPSYPVMWCATSDVTGPFGQTLKLEMT